MEEGDDDDDVVDDDMSDADEVDGDFDEDDEDSDSNEDSDSDADSAADPTRCVDYDVESVDDNPEPAEIEHVTDSLMTRYEMARILEVCTQQIAMGRNPMVDVGNETNPHAIAWMELMQKKSPIVVRRGLPGNREEVWRLEDMTLRDDMREIRIGQ